jgi:hypothetical protein
MGEHREKTQINGADLTQWFLFGAKEVAENRTELNRINYFPVADGDTGTNLHYTLQRMIQHGSPKPSFQEAMRQLSDAALSNARGNSGIIFASYINGMAKESRAYEQVTTKEFSEIASGAVDSLYEAVQEPVEGTMISVIKEWAVFLREHGEEITGFRTLFSKAYSHAHEALLKTTEQLAVLKEHKVVDSGAAGFVHFLKGMNDFFGSSPNFSNNTWAQKENSQSLLKADPPQYRYCTELLVQPHQFLPSEKLKKELDSFGDSLVVVTGAEKTKIHIHTDRPDLVLQKMEAHGIILEQKVDELEEVELANKQSIGLLTDSIADLPESYKKENHIHTLPLSIVFGDDWYLDKQTITLPQVIQKIEARTEHPTSSQPEPSRIRVFLEKYAEQYESLIFITVSSQMSGTYQSVIKEAKALGLEEDRLTVIDSKLNSGAQGLLVMKACEMLKNELPKEEITSRIKETIVKTKIYVCLNTIEYAAKGGRVSNTVGAVGMALKIRPIMSIDREGKGTTFGMGFSQAYLTRKIFSLMKKAMKDTGIEDYAIVHALNPKLAREYAQRLTPLVGKPPLFVEEISSLVAIHSGPGSVALCLIEK